MSSDHEATYQLLPPLTDDEREALRCSIAAVGVLQPVVVDETGQILDGHHRAAIAAELGVDCPTHMVDGLDHAGKVETALVLNLGRRHLTPAQKRALVAELRGRGLSIRWISERTGIPRSTVARTAAGVPSGTPERVQGRDGRTYGSRRAPRELDYVARRRPALHDEYAWHRRIAHETRALAAAWCRLEALDEPTDTDEELVATEACLIVAARELMRTGRHPDPPLWWKSISDWPERRAHEWEIRVERAAGQFLVWCHEHGVEWGRRGVQIPEGDDEEARMARGHVLVFSSRPEEFGIDFNTPLAHGIFAALERALVPEIVTTTTTTEENPC